MAGGEVSGCIFRGGLARKGMVQVNSTYNGTTGTVDGACWAGTGVGLWEGVGISVHAGAKDIQRVRIKWYMSMRCFPFYFLVTPR